MKQTTQARMRIRRYSACINKHARDMCTQIERKVIELTFEYTADWNFTMSPCGRTSSMPQRRVRRAERKILLLLLLEESLSLLPLDSITTFAKDRSGYFFFFFVILRGEATIQANQTAGQTGFHREIRVWGKVEIRRSERRTQILLAQNGEEDE